MKHRGTQFWPISMCWWDGHRLRYRCGSCAVVRTLATSWPEKHDGQCSIFWISRWVRFMPTMAIQAPFFSTKPWPSWGPKRWTSLARFKRLDAPAQFGAAASLAAILRPSGPGAPWKCREMACESRWTVVNYGFLRFINSYKKWEPNPMIDEVANQKWS